MCALLLSARFLEHPTQGGRGCFAVLPAIAQLEDDRARFYGDLVLILRRTAYRPRSLWTSFRAASFSGVASR
jgi:hypothetical protein